MAIFYYVELRLINFEGLGGAETYPLSWSFISKLATITAMMRNFLAMASYVR